MDHVLYFVANPARVHVGSTQQALDAAGRSVAPLRARHVRIAFETSLDRTLAKLGSGGADLLVIDARGELPAGAASPSLDLIRRLFDEHAVDAVVARARTWLVVDAEPRGAEIAFEVGRMRLGGVIAERDDQGLWASIWQKILASIARYQGGKVALCLAGGGTEGLFYELGALRAIQHFLPSYDLASVDIVCGISAGAVLGGFLANGVSLAELTRVLAGESDRFDPIRRWQLFDPNLADLGKRAASLSWEVARGRRSPLSALFRLPPAGMFAGAAIRRWLARQLGKPGMIDRFEDLPRQLFLGATDQDTNEHVVFGAPGAPSVPIHIAIRASTALVPFYAPEQIDGRYYVDGGFTRTTNMRVAVQQGATLVLLVDPLVPFSSQHPGHVANRGAVYVAMQGLKSLINGRFDKAVPTLRAMYPHVAFHLFQPGEAVRRVMAGSPMKYFYREAIEEIAYRETVRAIRAHRALLLARDFDRHGIRFEDPDARSPLADDDPEGERVVA